MVAGGAGAPVTEVWKMSNEVSYDGYEIFPYLDHYAYYPELFLVENDFCRQ